MTYRGGCHCGKVAFEVDSELTAVGQCNCSICTKKAYLHWIVERDRFRLLTPESNLAVYSFNTKTAKHYFCPVCGVASFYVPRSDPNKIDINVRCLDAVDISKLEVYFFDGRNWEEAHRQRAHTRFRAGQD